jgi:dynein heavy chain
MQSSILNSLAESNQDTILDNEMLIETLAISKEKSKEIAISLKKSELIGKTVSEKREQYREVSVRGSVLYFVIASLSSVDPMYQNSLAYVKKKFNETIRRIIGYEETSLEEDL